MWRVVHRLSIAGEGQAYECRDNPDRIRSDQRLPVVLLVSRVEKACDVRDVLCVRNNKLIESNKKNKYKLITMSLLGGLCRLKP